MKSFESSKMSHLWFCFSFIHEYKFYNKITIKVENSNIINHLNKLCMVGTSFLSKKNNPPTT